MGDPRREDEIREIRELSRRLFNDFFELQKRLARLEQENAAPTPPPTPPGPSRTESSRELHPLVTPEEAAAADRAAEATGVRYTSPPIPENIPGGFEFAIGTRWLNRVGAVIVLLAVAFFIKYSFDQGWLRPAVRCLLGAATGLGLIAGGEFSLHRKMAQFAVGLLGAGVAALDLSVFASHYVFSLVSAEGAFALYCAITVLSAVIAIHGGLQAVAVLAVIGGMLTPAAVSTGRDAQVELLTYLLLLDAGFLVAAAVRRWDLIRFLCWAGTAAYFAGWGLEFYRPEVFARTFAFLVVLYLLFWAGGLVSLRRACGWRVDPAPRFGRLNTAVFFAAAYKIVDPLHPEWAGLLALLTGLAQWAAALGIRPHPDRAVLARLALWIDGAVLLCLAVPIQFDGYSSVIGWTVQALVFAVAARRVPHGWLRAAPPLLVLLALGHLQIYELRDAPLLAPFLGGELWHLNRVVLLFVGVGLSAYAAAAMFTIRRVLLEGEAFVAGLLAVLGTAGMLFVFCHQFERFAATWAGLLLAAAFWMAARVAPTLGLGAVAVSLLAAAKFVGWDLGASVIDGHWRALDGFLANHAVFTAIFVCVGLAACLPLAARLPAWVGPDEARRSATTALALAVAVVIVVFGTFEIVRGFRFEPFRGRFDDPRRAMHLFLSVFWSVSALGMLSIGFTSRLSALRYLAIGVFALAVAKVMVVDISHLGMVYRILSFLVVGALLIAASWLYQRLAARVLPAGVRI